MKKYKLLFEMIHPVSKIAPTSKELRRQNTVLKKYNRKSDSEFDIQLITNLYNDGFSNTEISQMLKIDLEKIQNVTKTIK
jgi:hypothetical protein